MKKIVIDIFLFCINMATNKFNYLHVIKHTQLIACDLIIVNENNEVLLGMRNNEPAKNYWFTPGGRVYKNENMEDACKRISENEIGCEIKNGTIFGVYQHKYKNNFDNRLFGTVYVVFSHIFNVKKNDIHFKKDKQHSDLKWFNIDTLLENKDIHKYVKNYFLENPDNKIY